MYRIIKITGIQLIIVVLLTEAGLRIFSHYHHNINALLYNPHILSEYGEINTLKDLLKASPAGYSPYWKGRTFVLNSKSLSTKEYSAEKVSGGYRLLAIGDSFTDSSGGVPYSMLWPVVLEKNLSKKLGRNVDLIKLGVSGVGPRFELRLWQLEGKNLEADLVVLGFCVGTDFTDEQKDISVDDKNLIVSLLDYSYLARLLRNIYILADVSGTEQVLLDADAGRMERGGYPVESHYNPKMPTFGKKGFYSIVTHRMAITYKPDRTRFNFLFDQLKPVLLAFNEQVQRANARFVVMLIPEEYQIYPSLVEAVLESNNASLQDYDLDLPQRQLISFFKSNSIDYLDLLPAFRVAGKTESLYRLQDTHWNIEGNELAAKLLSDYLISNPVSR